MIGPPILIEGLVAIRGGPLELGKARPPQKGLKNYGGEGFPGSDKNWRGGLPIRTNNGQHLELPWHFGEGASGEFMVPLFSLEATE